MKFNPHPKPPVGPASESIKRGDSEESSSPENGGEDQLPFLYKPAKEDCLESGDMVIGQDLLLEKATESQGPNTRDEAFQKVLQGGEEPLSELQKSMETLNGLKKGLVFKEVEIEPAKEEVSLTSLEDPEKDSGQWQEILDSADKRVFDGEEEEKEDPEKERQHRQRMRKIYNLHQRVMKDYKTYLCQSPRSQKITIHVDQEIMLDPEKKANFQNKILLDFNLIEEQGDRVQSFINRAILEGKIKWMHQLKKLKHCLFESFILIRCLGRKLEVDDFKMQSKMSEGESGGEKSILEMENQVLNSMAAGESKKPEYTHTPYVIPIGDIVGAEE